MFWHNLQYSIPSISTASISLPASKSISNRLLILQKICTIDFEIENLSEANDTIILKEILHTNELPENIQCQDAGTVLRFMTCLCAAQSNKTFFLEGTERLLQRPMQELIECLEKMGARIDTLYSNNQVTSIAISGASLQSKVLSIPGNVTSQFISSLCLISPLIDRGLTLYMTEPILSKPYIELTLDLLFQFGIESSFEKNCIQIPKQKIKPKNIRVEADWSAASFFYSFFLLNDDLESIFIHELRSHDIQGDKHIIRLCNQCGIQTTFTDNGARLTKKVKSSMTDEIDLSNYPDLAIPFVLACAFVHPKIKFKGLSHLRSKESDRIEAMSYNLENFGILLKAENGTIWFEKSRSFVRQNKIAINTFNDHRIAMSFSLLACLGYEIALDNIDCIAKSFPHFLQEISKLGIIPKN